MIACRHPCSPGSGATTAGSRDDSAVHSRTGGTRGSRATHGRSRLAPGGAGATPAGSGDVGDPAAYVAGRTARVGQDAPPAGRRISGRPGPLRRCPPALRSGARGRGRGDLVCRAAPPPVQQRPRRSRPGARPGGARTPPARSGGRADRRHRDRESRPCLPVDRPRRPARSALVGGNLRPGAPHDGNAGVVRCRQGARQTVVRWPDRHPRGGTIRRGRP